LTSKGRDKAKPVWYASGLRFECRRCGQCCMGPEGHVWLERADVERLSSYLGVEANEFCQKYARRVGIGLALLAGPEENCVFFAERRCRVYEARPLQCRSFPFWERHLLSDEQWKSLTKQCPGINRGPLWTLNEIRAIQNGKMETHPKAFSHENLPVCAAAFRELFDLYTELELRLSKGGPKCKKCGRCCRFGPDSPRLFLSLLEFAYMADKGGPAKIFEGRDCPYLTGQNCANRDGRAVGCRTFFCEADSVESLQALHELALGGIRAISLRHGIPWDYRELFGHFE